MKRLMLDYFRRWSWLLALVGVLQFRFGWSIANRPEDDFEFWGLCLAGFMGANLLALDLGRGVVRAVAVLPLTGRQIGRSWWLATVPIPAIASAALLFLGAATFCHLHPNQVFPAARLAMASLFTLMWLGIVFTLIFNAPRGFRGHGWEDARTLFFGLLGIMMLFGGMLLCQGASRKPIARAIFLGVGAVLTVWSWLRAEQFDLGRDGQVDLGRLGQSNLRRPGPRLTALEPKIAPGRHCAPGGPGGIPFLIRTTFVRMFLYLAAMNAVIALLAPLESWWQGHAIPQDLAIVMFAGGSFMFCGFVIVFELLPVLRQLRWLRTLPISATRLAAVMIAITLLPLIALGALAAGVVGPALGASAAITFLKSYTYILAPASLCVFFCVWRGDGMQAYALLGFTLFGFLKLHGWLQLHSHRLELPFSLIGPIVAISVLLAFLLTRYALLHSSRAYRVQANPFGNAPWARAGEPSH